MGDTIENPKQNLGKTTVGITMEKIMLY